MQILPTDALAGSQASSEEDDYDRLPEAIKFGISRHEYLWMTDDQKANLIQQECEPEW